MTQAVPTEGFTAPPAAGNPPAAPNGTTINIPPPNPAPAPAAAEPAANPAGLDAAIAAMTAALKGIAPAAPEPAAPATTSVDSNLNGYDVNSIEDPIIKSMATVMQTVGKDIDLDRAIGKAIEDGRADLIDVAYLREKGGANAADLITIATSLVNAVAAKSAAVSSEVYSLAGGQAQWDAGVAVFNQAAPQELRLVVAQMLDSGKEQLVKAGAKMVVEFSKNSGHLPSVNPLLNTGVAAPAAAAQALDKVGFQTELRKLNPQDRDYIAQREQLFARRQLGRQLGK